MNYKPEIIFIQSIIFFSLWASIGLYGIAKHNYFAITIFGIIGVIFIICCIWYAHTIRSSKEYVEQIHKEKVLKIKRHIRKIKFRRRETR